MTLVGSFRAGVDGDYELLLTKSVLDGFMAVLLTAAMGIGVAFASLVILVYQGGLTLLSRVLQPLVSAELMAELSAVGGVLIVMIGINLLGLRQLKTANFLPAFAVMVALIGINLLGLRQSLSRKTANFLPAFPVMVRAMALGPRPQQA